MRKLLTKKFNKLPWLISMHFQDGPCFQLLSFCFLSGCAVSGFNICWWGKGNTCVKLSSWLICWKVMKHVWAWTLHELKPKDTSWFLNYSLFLYILARLCHGKSCCFASSSSWSHCTDNNKLGLLWHSRERLNLMIMRQDLLQFKGCLFNMISKWIYGHLSLMDICKEWVLLVLTRCVWCLSV